MSEGAAPNPEPAPAGYPAKQGGGWCACARCRCRGLFWPVMLITVGAISLVDQFVPAWRWRDLWPVIGIVGLFLYANLHPEFSAWALLAKYWPVLIIFWGLGKLVDYLMLRGTPESAAASRLTGGDIFGIILLLIFGTAVNQAVNRDWGIDGPIRIGGEELGCFLGKEFEFSQEVKQAVTAPGSLTLENSRGNVTITGGAGKEIRLVARKKVCAASDAEAYRLSQAFEPVLASTGTGYELQWNVLAGDRRAVAADLDVH